MKKNILTVIILAIVLINTVLTGVLIFTIVPTANKTNTLVSKVASIVDLELESPDNKNNVGVEDIKTYPFPEELTVNLKSINGKESYAKVNVSLSMNIKHKDYGKLQGSIEENIVVLQEFVQDEFAKYTKDEILNSKEKIKQDILKKIKEYTKSDFIIRVNFGKLLIG